MSLEQLQTLYGCLRAEYLQRVVSWAAAFRASLECREVAVVIPDPVRPVDPASTWLASPAGKEVIKELRWLSRISAEPSPVFGLLVTSRATVPRTRASSAIFLLKASLSGLVVRKCIGIGGAKRGISLMFSFCIFARA